MKCSTKQGWILLSHFIGYMRFLAFFNQKSSIYYRINNTGKCSMINFIVLDNPFDCPFSLNHIVADIRIKSFARFCPGISIILTIPCGCHWMRHTKYKMGTIF